jgi:hypothetical protein
MTEITGGELFARALQAEGITARFFEVYPEPAEQLTPASDVSLIGGRP